MEELVKKFSIILDELHKYTPHAWDQLVGAVRMDAILYSIVAVLCMIASSYLSIFFFKKGLKMQNDSNRYDSNYGFYAGSVVSLAVFLMFLFMLADSLTSVFYPEAEIIKNFLINV